MKKINNVKLQNISGGLGHLDCFATGFFIIAQPFVLGLLFMNNVGDCWNS